MVKKTAGPSFIEVEVALNNAAIQYKAAQRQVLKAEQNLAEKQEAYEKAIGEFNGRFTAIRSKNRITPLNNQ